MTLIWETVLLVETRIEGIIIKPKYTLTTIKLDIFFHHKMGEDLV